MALTDAWRRPAVDSERPGPDGAPFWGYPRDELVEDLRMAFVSRAIDDREIVLQKQSRAFFHISGAGHEALLLALARSLRPGADWFFPYYRDRALLLALGVTPYEMLLQAVGSGEDPASGGRQMPSHWGSVERNVVTQSSPTGSQCLPAVGCAEAGRYLNSHQGLTGCRSTADEITYVSLGDGAVSEGEFWESLNSACTLRLPVLYVVEDNGYAISVPACDQGPAPISTLVSSFPGLHVHRVDGRDYIASRRAAERVVGELRAGGGPALLHATVTRPYGHSVADVQSKYRAPEELAEEVLADPIRLLAERLVRAQVLDEAGVAALQREANEEVALAAKRALAATRPDPASVTEHLYVLPELGPEPEPVPVAPSSPAVTFGEAIRLTLHEQMGLDGRILVFGEDVADGHEAIRSGLEGKGGVFGTTRGLERAFGSDRCFNTPLAEANIVGRAVGHAVRGLRPIPEIQFFDYIWPAMQQIKSEAATIRWRSNGAFRCPMVLRVPIGGHLRGGAIWHSQSGESIFAHMPGLLIAFPSRAQDAAGLLRAALQGEDPVLFLEHKHLLRQSYAAGPFPSPGYVVPFGRGRCVRPGQDLTLVAWGSTVEQCRRAAQELEERDGASVEVLDLRTIVPWDQELVAESVRRTGRVMVVHEDVLTCGFGAEVAAWIGEELFSELDGPVRRVAAKDAYVAYEPELEAATLPQVDDVVAAARSLLSF